MTLTPFHGFCMALADSVPGVSGGTIAFILGFYERFLGSVHDLFRGRGETRREALRYLLRLGIGWCVGMAACVLALSALFTRQIYFMSSLFLGLTAASIPLIAMAERETLRRIRCAVFTLPGAALVVALTLLRGGAASALDYAQLRPVQLLWLFLAGAAAITAMVLPGISGSSVLLIAGVYLPTVQAARELLHLHLAVLPGLCALGLGILTGAALSVRSIRTALRRYRAQMVWLILGLMAGSLYAIVCGPASVQPAMPPLTLATFRPLAFVLGIALLLGLEGLQRAAARQTAKGAAQ